MTSVQCSWLIHIHVHSRTHTLSNGCDYLVSIVDVVVAEDDSLFDKVNKWPSLFTSCCYCDVYSPWSHEAYVCIAERWLSLEPSLVYVVLFVCSDITFNSL